MILMLLPFPGSGFVPTASMPEPLRWFVEHQPFTPINETLRGLLLGSPMGDSWVVAVAWCVGISPLGYLWSRRLYERLPARPAGSDSGGVGRTSPEESGAPAGPPDIKRTSGAFPDGTPGGADRTFAGR